ncbi:uncharacterized protein LOC120672729 isoform X2 [Panicum virgatum]|uniref:uncharacterized protein LOC120672729 isoform X2 n=1 Tax=Panicum virgatum TaxID=38727 RepID=UPI0019D55C37|nr:uncharacterized protein LOC120672729 isoform X2 [Panicum virgatum]
MDSQGMEALPPLALWGFDPIRFMSLFGWNFGISLSILFLCCFLAEFLEARRSAHGVTGSATSGVALARWCGKQQRWRRLSDTQQEAASSSASSSVGRRRKSSPLLQLPQHQASRPNQQQGLATQRAAAQVGMHLTGRGESSGQTTQPKRMTFWSVTVVEYQDRCSSNE